MKLPVRFTADAEADLSNIYDYIASDSPRTAEIYTLELVEAAHRIGDMPHMGRRRDDLGEGLRSFSFRRTQVFIYEVTFDRVRILRIFSAGQDVEALLGE